MKAQYINFNSEWHKDCPKCGTAYGANSLEGLCSFFTKDKNKSDGLDPICKSCKKHYRQVNKDKELARWKKYYSPGTENRKRHVVRSQTRRKLGSAKQHNCSICNNKADEWHHIAYTTDNAVPLCSNCHEKVDK